MSFLRFLILCLLCSTAGVVHAYEVDNFTGREQLKRDSREVLNREVNLILDRARRQANLESRRYCSRVLLRQEILRWVRPDPVSILELWAANTQELQQTHASASQSIYAGASLSESPAIWVGGIGRSLLLAGHVVGTDKIGHFFMQGRDYWTMVDAGRTIDDVLKNEHGEEGLWGRAMTGVKSYADMAANYQGFRFWSALYSGPRPYFRCEEDTGWIKLREFDWADYVSDAWDEAINCSDMKPTLELKVQARLKKLGMSCPIDPKRCESVAKLEKSEFFMSPKCAAAIADVKEKGKH